MLKALIPTLICAACAWGQTDDIWNQAIRGTGNRQQQRRLPDGFRVVAQSGTGQAIFGSASGARSAKAAFTGLFRHASSYFDGPPTLQSAFTDARDSEVQAFFRGGFQGGPMTGLMIVTVANGNVQALLFFDRPDQFGRSLGNMSQQVSASLPQQQQGGGGRGPAPIPRMTRTQLSDGSGWVDLPQGYVITGAFKGVVDITGPQGQSVSLGGYQSVYMRGSPGSTLMSGAYRPPWQALQLYIDCTTKGILSRGQGQLRLIERAPERAQGAQAEWLSYELSTAQGRYRGFAYVSTAQVPSDMSLWVYYMSAVAAPSDRFAQDFPTMLAMWKSWGVNQAVYRERMDAALQSMRDTYSIWRAGTDNTTRVTDNAMANYSQMQRGVTTVQNVITRERGQINTNYAEQAVNELNRQGGQYRIVPTNELTGDRR